MVGPRTDVLVESHKSRGMGSFPQQKLCAQLDITYNRIQRNLMIYAKGLGHSGTRKLGLRWKMPRMIHIDVTNDLVGSHGLHIDGMW